MTDNDLSIPLDPEPATPLCSQAAPRMSFEDAIKQPRPFTYVSIETGALTTIGGDPDPTDPRTRPAPGLLRCMGIGTPDPLQVLGAPSAPTPVVAPTAAQRKKMLALPVLTHSEALAETRRPLSYVDAATKVVTTIN